VRLARLREQRLRVMTRLVIVAAIFALGASVGMAAATPREIDPVEAHAGVYRVEYWTADGPESHRLSAAAYAQLVKSRACDEGESQVLRWPRARLIQAICGS
jgi:hypothetical protein